MICKPTADPHRNPLISPTLPQPPQSEPAPVPRAAQSPPSIREWLRTLRSPGRRSFAKTSAAPDMHPPHFPCAAKYAPSPFRFAEIRLPVNRRKIRLAGDPAFAQPIHQPVSRRFARTPPATESRKQTSCACTEPIPPAARHLKFPPARASTEQPPTPAPPASHQSAPAAQAPARSANRSNGS